MADDFAYDVFLSHSPKDTAVVRALADRLRADGLRVWYFEWALKRGDDIAAKVEEALEHSRALVIKAKEVEGKFDIFLSHNTRDKPAVEKIARRLLAVGIRPWLDKWNLSPGD